MSPLTKMIAKILFFFALRCIADLLKVLWVFWVTYSLWKVTK
jgi:hypothetical protein